MLKFRGSHVALWLFLGVATNLESGVFWTDDFGRHMCTQYTLPAIANSRTASENKSAQKTVCHCVYTNSYITKFDIQGYLYISSA